MSMFRLVIILIITVACGLTPLAETRADDRPKKRLSVSELIERLGSDSYATRIRARDKLQRLGLDIDKFASSTGTMHGLEFSLYS